ncbi:MAG: hypothetical protein HZB61_13615 [Nitrospirae bacterium]|nr:hypothetical protein [Nitrospirota bacterium]
MTVKDENGKVLYSKSEDYIVNDFYIKKADPSKDPIMVANWWFDRQVHLHEGIEPGEVKSTSFVVPLEKGAKSATVEAAFVFHYEKGKDATWNKATKKIEF